MNRREIKFRAWDRMKKQFDTCRNGGSNLSFGMDYKGIHSLSGEGYKVYQQFTGLKDKNGKEIYEGDIVKDSNRTKYQLIWVEIGLGHWWIKRVKDDFSPGKNPINLNLIEVVGNIYEHSELLKEKNV